MGPGCTGDRQKLAVIAGAVRRPEALCVKSVGYGRYWSARLLRLKPPQQRRPPAADPRPKPERLDAPFGDVVPGLPLGQIQDSRDGSDAMQ